MPTSQWMAARDRRASQQRARDDQRPETGSVHPTENIEQLSLEERQVLVDEPDLSPRTNERLTEELKEAVGASSVKVPVTRPHVTTGAHPESRSWMHVITVHRMVMALTLAMLLTIAAIISLRTGDWWLLAVACVVHAAGTILVLTIALRLTRSTEHPSPTLAAAMTEEGIASPDRAFSEMVEEFRAPEAEDLDQFQNARTVSPQQVPATATAQQASAITPGSQPSQPSTGASAAEVVVVVLAFGFSVDAVVIPLCSGGHWLWLIPAIVLPLCIALTVLRRHVVRSDENEEGAGVVVDR